MNRFRIGFLLSALLLVPACGDLSATKQAWPDGTTMDKWFSEEPRPLPKREAKRFVITDYGAVADSTVLQTDAIQKAIDAAAVRGGTVVIPEGVYLSGALFFKPGTHLLLEKGAVLKGSDRTADYPDTQVHIEGVLQPYAAALVNAEGADGFSLTGEGFLDGNGLRFWNAFWQRRKENPACTNLEVRRPRMVSVSGARDILIEGVRLRNAGFWNVHLYKCTRVRIRGIDIYAPVEPVKAPSSDGIDLDACTDVHIEDCRFATGDDLIAVKGGKGPWADTDPDNGINERILVERCHFGHGPGALVFGSECIGARNILLRDSEVRGTERLLWLKMRPDTPQDYRSIRIENVEGEVGRILYVRPWKQFFDLKGRKDIPKSSASDILFTGCRIKCRMKEDIEEAPDQYSLENVRWEGNRIKFSYNKDEALVKPYTLEDPLRFADGRRVRTPAEWRDRQKEILEIFQREMYGRMPAPCPIYTEVLEEGPAAEIPAIRRQVRMWFHPDHTGPHVDWLMILPRDAKGPSPAILSLNFYGNHTIIPDKEVLIPDCWLDDDEKHQIADHRASEAGRGLFTSGAFATTYPLAEIVGRGFAFVTACYGDLSADPDDPELQPSLCYGGVFSLWGERDPERTDQTEALAAWAWGLMRGMDMLEGQKEIDPGRVVVSGCSRLGKAALVAGAFDERFPVVVLNQTGGGGVPLAKRDFGETVASEIAHFTHWYAKAYRRYAGREKDMPFDQHMLVSCIAPRALLVEGFDNPWFDTHGEFLSLKAASPVWTFLGAPGLPDTEWPADDDLSAVGTRVGYYHRSGEHGYYDSDWRHLLDFSEKALPEKEQGAPVEVVDCDDLTVYYPRFSRIDLATGTMPPKSRDDIVFCCAAAFTGERLRTFSHSNIAGHHVSGGTFYEGYRCGPNNGLFTWSAASGWHFYNLSYKNTVAPLKKAAKEGGMGFGQSLLYLDGKAFTGCFKADRVNRYRALCEIGGRLCIVDCALPLPFGDFMKGLKRIGVRNAIYCDMGRGWNYSWYRQEDGSVREIFPEPGRYTTNWIAFLSI